MGSEGENSSSKGITWALIIIVTVAFIVSAGLGIELGLNRPRKDENLIVEQTTKHPSTHVTPSSSKEGRYRFAAVAADAEECSKIGNHVMAVQGGSAIDAAIAAILCVGVHNAHSCGIGGGHFLTYYNRKNRTVHTVIAREQAPKSATETMFVNGSSSTTGGMAIGIPGEIRGLYEAHKLGGKLPWKQLFQPAIELCRKGIKVGKALVEGMTNKEEFFKNFTFFKELITNNETGKIYKEGEIMKRPKLARTLEILADDHNAFYNGSLAENITEDIKDAGGIITIADLANYTAKLTEPLVFRLYDNLKVYSPPPPSSGAVYQFILNVLNGYNFSADSVSTIEKSVLTWHRITETFKHAYSLRSSIGDVHYAKTNFTDYVNDLVKNMTDPAFGERKRELINDTATFGTAFYKPQFSNQRDYGTAHLSVLGPNGDAVSITSTVNLHFGSKVIGNRTGIVFNNEMDDFSTPGTINSFGVPASPANYIKPWKRPMSSMCPSIIVGADDEVVMVVGASGGTRITTATALVTIESLWFGLGIKESIDYPRMHHQLYPQEISIQNGFPQILIEGLKERGHNISMDVAGSVVQGILRRADYVTANSDYRKYGAPDGY